MSWLIVAGIATAVTVDTTLQQGKQQQYDLERQAEEEKIEAKGRELERRERLNDVLARSAVNQAASGIGIEGTPESIALATAKKASLSEGLEGLSDRLRQSQLKRAAKNARRSSYAEAGSTLLKGSIDMGQLS